jgi:glycine betaine catabolism A
MTTFLKHADTYVPGARTLPGHAFTSPDIYAEELEKIIYRHWLCVGRADQIPQRGDYLVQAIGGESVLIVHERQDQLRAFYNVCRHRGTRLCEAARGQVSETIQCPYHAWTYSLDGRLIGAPFMQEVPGFDKQDYALHRVALAQWDGFIFVNLSAEAEPFERVYAALLKRFARFNLAQLRSAGRRAYEVRANWKLIVENYSECLHCPTLHPALAKISPFMSGENDLVEGLVLGGSMDIAPEADSLTLSGRACGVPVGDLPEEDRRRVYYYSIFPNMLLSLHPDYVMFHTLWPQSADRTRVTCEWLFHPAAFERADFNPRDAIEFWDMTNRQDWHICELSQQGIASRSYTPGPYSPRESIPAAWDRAWISMLGR